MNLLTVSRTRIYSTDDTNFGNHWSCHLYHHRLAWIGTFQNCPQTIGKFPPQLKNHSCNKFYCQYISPSSCSWERGHLLVFNCLSSPYIFLFPNRFMIFFHPYIYIYIKMWIDVDSGHKYYINIYIYKYYIQSNGLIDQTCN